jgi:hypothetical protein
MRGIRHARNGNELRRRNSVRYGIATHAGPDLRSRCAWQTTVLPTIAASQATARKGHELT